MFTLGTNSSRTFQRYAMVCAKISRFIKLIGCDGTLSILGINDSRICHIVITFGVGFFENVDRAGRFEAIVDSKQLMMLLRTINLTTVDSTRIWAVSDTVLSFQFTAGYGVCTTKRISHVDSLGWGRAEAPVIPPLPYSMIIRSVVLNKVLSSFAANSPTTVLALQVVGSDCLKLCNYDLMTTTNSTTTEITLNVSELDACNFGEGNLPPLTVPLSELKVLGAALQPDESATLTFGTAGQPMLVRVRSAHLGLETTMTLATGISAQIIHPVAAQHQMPAQEPEDLLNLIASLPMELEATPRVLLTPVATPEPADDDDFVPGTPSQRQAGFDWAGQFNTLW